MTFLRISCLLLALSACSPTVTHPSSLAKLAPAAANDAPKAYHIGVGDELEVKFFFAPELNDVMQVRPDGKISMMFVQDLDAAGKTPDELADMIRKSLKKHVVQSDLVVIMRGYASQKIYIGGEVARGGSFQLTGPENVMQVLSEAGWITPAANRDEIALIRRDADGVDGVYPLSLRKIMSGEDMSQNVTLQAGDMVLVPPSNVASFDRWIDQHIRQAVPLNSGVVITNQVNNSGL